MCRARLVAHMDPGSSHLFCSGPFLKSLQVGGFTCQKRKEGKPCLLPPWAFQTSECLGAIKPDTSEQGGMSLVSLTTNIAHGKRKVYTLVIFQHTYLSRREMNNRHYLKSL